MNVGINALGGQSVSGAILVGFNINQPAVLIPYPPDQARLQKRGSFSWFNPYILTGSSAGVLAQRIGFLEGAGLV